MPVTYVPGSVASRARQPLDASQPDVAAAAGPGGADSGAGEQLAFAVHLDIFHGPFDLLLGLIGKHKLDITEVALAQVTDEFVAYIRAMPRVDLDQISGFLVVAATLLDLKAARLLPAAQVESEEDLAVLEARDLLFARLLEYKAYKELAGWVAQTWEREARSVRRTNSIPPEFTAALPPLVLGMGLADFARLAIRALAPPEMPTVAIDHIHAPRISVADHMTALTRRLVDAGAVSFRDLCIDCHEIIEIVGRFLAVLELFREGCLALDQLEPLAPLQVRWVATRDVVELTSGDPG